MNTGLKVVVVFGVAVVVAIGGSVAFRVLNKPAEVAQTTTQASLPPSPAADAKVRQGSFTTIDTIHKGSGQAVVVKSSNGAVLSFENFSVTNGPDLFVYLSKSPTAAQDKKLGEYVSLGKLKSTEGPQTYTLPDNYQDYQAVFIWCRAFSQVFSVAQLSS